MSCQASFEGEVAVDVWLTGYIRNNAKGRAHAQQDSLELGFMFKLSALAQGLQIHHQN